MRRSVLFAALICLAILFGSLPATAAMAQIVIDVTVFDDPVPDGSCGAGGDCSLREAVILSNNTNGPGNTIRLAAGADGGAGTYALTLGAPSNDDAGSGDLDIYGGTTVAGPVEGSATIEVTVADRAFDVQGGVLTLKDLTISGGGTVPAGGAVRSSGGILNLASVTLSGNQAQDGGAVYARLASVVTIADSTIRGNQVTGSGGGIYMVVADGLVADSPLTITDSIIDANTAGAAGEGGGVFTTSVQALIERTEISGNRSGGANGIVLKGPHSTATMTDVTVQDNQGATSGGRGIEVSDTAFAATRLVVDGNAGGGLILRSSPATVTDSYFVSNTGTGIDNNSGASLLQLDRSTIEGNRGGVGGIAAFAPVDVTSSTISGNVGSVVGGVLVQSAVTLTSSTIAANRSVALGAGNIGIAAPLDLNSSVLATPGGGLEPDDLNCVLIDGGTISGTGSLADDNSCPLEADNLTGVAAGLMPLQQAGGLWPTYGLTPTSAAIDIGGQICPALDARDAARPVDGDQDGTVACDAGAVEFVPLADLTLTLADGPDPVPIDLPLTLTGTVFNAGPQPAVGTSLLIAVDSGAAVEQVTTTQGTCTVAEGQAACTLGELASGTDVTIRASVRAGLEGTLTATATAMSPTADPTPADREAQSITTVGPVGSTPGQPPPPGPGQPPGQPPGEPLREVIRLAGATRIQTAIAVSQRGFDAGGADAVVLARADLYADALAGTPLAVASGAPLLLTATDSLHPDVVAELQRVLGAGGEVILLGGPTALSQQVEDIVTELGFAVRRLAGGDRAATAVAIAQDGLGDPTQLLLADGQNFPDALAAGPAAAAVDGAVLLTAGSSIPPALQAYLDSLPDDRTLIAIGRPAADAMPLAEAVAGASRVETAVAVATRFFSDPGVVGIATGDNFPDALAGGAHMGGQGGPILLTDGASLHPAVATYLVGPGARATPAYLYGGTGVLSETVEQQVGAAGGPPLRAD